MTVPLLIILITFCILFSIFLLVSYITYRIAFYQGYDMRDVDVYANVKDDGTERSAFTKKILDEIQTIPYENIYVTSHDGLRLRGRLYMIGDDLPFVIEAHGYRSTPMIDFSGGGVLMMELGFNVIMIDERAHGESEGKTITFGLYESRDLLKWIEYIREHYGSDRKIILQGMSMGATSVLMASGLELPNNVKGILADCPYSSAEDIIKLIMKEKMKLPIVPCYSFLRLGAKMFGKFDPKYADAVSAVRNANVPILIIHGEEDTFVPCEMSKKIASNNKSIKYETFSEANHGLSFICDYERYKNLVINFSSECLRDKNLVNANNT